MDATIMWVSFLIPVLRGSTVLCGSVDSYVAGILFSTRDVWVFLCPCRYKLLLHRGAADIGVRCGAASILRA